ncbi:hypothetical protein NCC78_01545 [Micromonospora phytophila]|uniref:hypothetical protein n=1 Tax=Micromonospora phytophila TaxID=709888 RepID=UPI0020307F17|nr:hypothetical protein [Micromonospora phytophila]MCM0673410.1 hypothetical protein [Micromonospora phytophila]
MAMLLSASGEQRFEDVAAERDCLVLVENSGGEVGTGSDPRLSVGSAREKLMVEQQVSTERPESPVAAYTITASTGWYVAAPLVMVTRTG